VDFDPVWVSSVQHMQTFASIFASAVSKANIARYEFRLHGRYDIPDGFPYVVLGWATVRRRPYPLVMFAKGGKT
jgi:hypothetical protein